MGRYGPAYKNNNNLQTGCRYLGELVASDTRSGTALDLVGCNLTDRDLVNIHRFKALQKLHVDIADYDITH